MLWSLAKRFSSEIAGKPFSRQTKLFRKWPSSVDTHGPRQLSVRSLHSGREYFPYNFNEPIDEIPSQLGKYVSDVFVSSASKAFLKICFDGWNPKFAEDFILSVIVLSSVSLFSSTGMPHNSCISSEILVLLFWEDRKASLARACQRNLAISEIILSEETFTGNFANESFR